MAIRPYGNTPPDSRAIEQQDILADSSKSITERGGKTERSEARG